MTIRDGSGNPILTVRDNGQGGQGVYDMRGSYLGYTNGQGTFDAHGHRISYSAVPGLLYSR